MNNPLDQIGHSELVRASDGNWPSFHDAEVERVELRTPGPTLVTRIVIMERDDKVPAEVLAWRRRSIALEFTAISNLSVRGFNEQNVLAGLEISVRGSRFGVVFESIYGLECEFECEGIAAIPAHTV